MAGDDNHGWNHPQCAGCWIKENPTRVARRLVAPDSEECCYCGALTRSGIYRRVKPGDPRILHCRDTRTMELPPMTPAEIDKRRIPPPRRMPGATGGTWIDPTSRYFDTRTVELPEEDQ